MKNVIKPIIVSLIVAMLAMTLTACGSQNTTNTTSNTTVSSNPAEWKTLGDALASKGEDFNTSSWDEDHYLAVFQVGDTFVRVVAKMTPEAYAQIEELDASMPEYDEQFAKVVENLELISADDLSSEMLTQEQLDAYIGKTGKDLINDGLTFQYYYMYGDEETGVTMNKGYLAYQVTFDVTVPETAIEDGGASIENAVISGITCVGGSDTAVDPTL